MGFYSTFEQLCERSGVTPAKVRADLGISQSTMASWKSRGLTPKPQTIQMIADYFEVSPRELVGLYSTTLDIVKVNQTLLYQILANIKHGTATERDMRTLEDMSVAFSAMMPRQLYGHIAQLNEIGKQKVVDYAKDLTHIPEYTQELPETAQQLTPLPAEGQSTIPPPDAPETAPEGE